MKAFVQKVLEKYPSFLREKAQFERHLEMRENKEMRDAQNQVGRCGKLVYTFECR